MSENMSDYEKVIELLKKYRELTIDIKALELDIKEQGLRGVSYNDMPGSPLPSNTSPVEISLNKIERLRIDKGSLEIKKEKIENIFKVLNNTEVAIIKYRHIDKLMFKEISYKVNMNADYLVTKHKEIIEKLIPYALRHNLI